MPLAPAAAPTRPGRGLSLLIAAAGAFVTLACVAVAAFGAFHVVLDTGGHVSAAEAAPALIGGVACAMVTGALTLVGLSAGRRRAPFPTHFVAGIVALVALASSCVGFGSSFALYEQARTYDARADAAEDDVDLFYEGHRATRSRTWATGAAACSAFTLLLGAASALSVGVLARRYRAGRQELAPRDDDA